MARSIDGWIDMPAVPGANSQEGPRMMEAEDEPIAKRRKPREYKLKIKPEPIRIPYRTRILDRTEISDQIWKEQPILAMRWRAGFRTIKDLCRFCMYLQHVASPSRRGINRGTWSQFETGQKPIAAGLMISVAKIFRVPPGDLLNAFDKMHEVWLATAPKPPDLDDTRAEDKAEEYKQAVKWSERLHYAAMQKHKLGGSK